MSGSSRASFYNSRPRSRWNWAAVNTTTRTKLSQLPRKYQCAVCTETFARRYSWQRHEECLHLSVERWECSPEGPYTQDVDGHLICAFRSELEPDQHVSTHNYNVCKDRSPEERLFYRKDHFIQHLKAAHNPNDNMPL
ncbi:hypothetical protein EDB81DRAFT_828303 [Dactylonectria macrodidyma]|uniref:C2H2-type domain-containing protein n=1 Tax=Dactylonectria macrodidyma TaxID=307937 RepID=A0A9P9D3U0_9HYPO|nr:hypothetical protein EDB81DRAFT_828303 [Dactylonectria macrodidyma]